MPDEKVLSPGELECLLALLRHTYPVSGDQVAQQLGRKRAGVTTNLGVLDTLGLVRYSLPDDIGAWELTEQGRAVALKIAATRTHRRNR